jgi:hypothetical protein
MDTRILSLFYNKFLTKTKKEINGLVYTVTLDDKFYDYVNDRFAGVLLDDIWGTPLLSDQDYMYTSTNVDFFDKKGDRISWWV